MLRRDKQPLGRGHFFREKQACLLKKLGEKCIFFLKMFGSYEKMLIFAPNFMLLMREFSLSMSGREQN